MLEINKIHQMDCLEGMKLIPSESCEIAIVDPPYGIDFNSNYRKKSELKTTKGIANDGVNNTEFLSQVIDEMNRILKPNSHIYWFTRWDKVKDQQPLLEQHFKVKNALVWMKNNWSMGDLFGAYAGQYESILFAQKGRRKLNEVNGIKRHTDILQFDRISPNKLRHSHEKPVDLIEFLVMKSSNEGDTALIPFGGVGSECVAAAGLNRNFYSFELDEDLCAIGNSRLWMENNL